MKFQMVTPCPNCPFRTDVDPYLRRDRGRHIVASLARSTFACHKTTVSRGSRMVETPDSQHCAGALIMLEHVNAPSQMMRIAERLGIYDPMKLDMKAPVFASPGAFVAAQGNPRITKASRRGVGTRKVAGPQAQEQEFHNEAS